MARWLCGNCLSNASQSLSAVKLNSHGAHCTHFVIDCCTRLLFFQRQNKVHTTCSNLGHNVIHHSLSKHLRKSSHLNTSLYGKIPGRTFFIMNTSSEEGGVFKGTKDRYQGITVSSNEEPCSTSNFLATLHESLDIWKKSQVRGVWFKVFLKHAEWVPVLAQNGFEFHHAKPDYVMMCKWLPEVEDVCNIPCYSHTMVGVGAIVVNSKDEILVVREKFFERPHWKLPGGYVEPGEDIVDAAIREVAEETSVRTKFHTVVAYRHTQTGSQFGCSDIYFIVNLSPLSEEIRKCDHEIAACEWMKVIDFLNHPHVHATNRQFVKTFLEYRSSGLKITYEKNTHPTMNRLQCIYSASLSTPRHSEVGAPSSGMHLDDIPERQYNVDSSSGLNSPVSG